MQEHENRQFRSVAVPAHFHGALALLLEAAQYAAQTGSNRWEFAVELDQLLAAGVSHNDLRLLAKLGLVNHASEVTQPGTVGRQFCIINNLAFTTDTCFTLTPRGLAAAMSGAMAQLDVVRHSITNQQPDRLAKPANTLPVWDANRHKLTFNGKLVKHFKRHALNQELILSAFHEENWPSHIDDPLPPAPDLNSKRRLGYAIQSLNHEQVHQLVHFSGDGTGQGIIWESAT